MGRLTTAEAEAFKGAVEKSTAEAEKVAPAEQLNALFTALSAECSIVALTLAKHYADTLAAELKARDERHAEHLKRLETRMQALERSR